jgi:O-antigen/teichoic acid export membrane protein
MQLTAHALTRQTTIYGAFQLFQRGLAFAIIPVYTHYLSPEEFGKLDVLNLTVWFIGIIGGSKLSAAFIRYFGQAQARDEVNRLLGSSLTGLVVPSALLFALVAVFADPLLSALYSSSALPRLGFHLALATTWLTLLAALPLAYLRTQQEAGLVGSINLLGSLAGSLLGVAGVVILQWGLFGILLGAAIAALLVALTSYYIVLRRVRPCLDLSYVGPLYRYALPMLPAPLFMYFLNYSDRYFLLHYCSLEEVGIYGMAGKFALLINLALVAPFGEMWGANQFALYEARKKETYRKLALTYVSLLYLGALCIAYLSYEVTTFALQQAFHGLLWVVAPLCVGVAVWGIVPTLDFGCLLRNKTWVRSMSTGIAALTSIGLNFVLVPRLGSLGAAIGTLLSYLALVVVTYIWNRKLTDYCLDVRKAGPLSLLLILLASLVYLHAFISYSAFVVVRLTGLALFIVALLKLNGVPARDLFRLVLRRPVPQ